MLGSLVSIFPEGTTKILVMGYSKKKKQKQK